MFFLNTYKEQNTLPKNDLLTTLLSKTICVLTQRRVETSVLLRAFLTIGKIRYVAEMHEDVGQMYGMVIDWMLGLSESGGSGLRGL